MERSSAFRVFVSYSHEELDFAKKIVEILGKLHLVVLWDQKFSVGTGFNEQIQTFISYSHIFLPIITKKSAARGWVHQEIGYAVAQNIPILPLAIDRLPDAMMQGLHALVLPRNLEGVEETITLEKFEHLVRRYRNETLASNHSARFTEDRSRMMAGYANEILLLGQTGEIRQKGGLSSFHIPFEGIMDNVWTERYGGKPQTPIHCHYLREERLALEQHARKSGCRLIINPSQEYTALGPIARIRRLECLVRFLESENGEKAQVAIDTGLNSNVSVTIIGDWIYAESVSAYHGAGSSPSDTSDRSTREAGTTPTREGVWQTNFTRHAPSILDRVELFDQEFCELLRHLGWSAHTSRQRALVDLRELIEKLYREHPDVPMRHVENRHEPDDEGQ